MPRNLYPGKTVSELLVIREAIMEARHGGSQTSVGVAPGIRHDFAGLSQKDLNERLTEVDYALFLLDPDTYENPHQGKVMKVSTVYR